MQFIVNCSSIQIDKHIVNPALAIGKNMMDPVRKAKLIWRCRRGMLELDLLFQWFIANYVDKLTDEEIESLELLLTSPDPDLYQWLMGQSLPENKELHHIVALIQSHSQIQHID